MMVSSDLSNSESNSGQLTHYAWDNAIRDAEGEIRFLSRQIARLRQAIRIFEANKRDGLKWPSGNEGETE
jgi:hypothetical protein